MSPTRAAGFTPEILVDYDGVAVAESTTHPAEPEPPDEVGAFPRYAAGDPLARAFPSLAQVRGERSLFELDLDLASRRTRVRLGAPRARSGEAAEAAPIAEEPRVAPESALSWLELELVDSRGKPVGGQRYVVVLPDGTERRGRIGPGGVARLEEIPHGTCRVSFPDLDGRELSSA
jgi:hypothetical protein